MILHGFVNDVIKEKNKIKSVVIFYKGQKIYCEGDVFIDCTEDGDIAYLSGADFIKGWEVIEFYRKYMKGFEKVYLQQTFTQAGGRESRRIIGEYILKEEDILECKNFPDNIAKGSYPIDILIPDGPMEKIKKFKLWYTL